MKAIKDINFLPDYVLRKQISAKRNATIAVWILICAVFVVGLYMLPIQVYNYYLAKSNECKIQLSKLSDVQEKVNELDTLRKNKDKKRTAIAKINSKQIRIVENIDKINNIIPANVTMKNLTFSGKDINAFFIVNSPMQVIDLLDRLERLNIFKKVAIASSPIIDEESTINIKLQLK